MTPSGVLLEDPVPWFNALDVSHFLCLGKALLANVVASVLDLPGEGVGHGLCHLLVYVVLGELSVRALRDQHLVSMLLLLSLLLVFLYRGCRQKGDWCLIFRLFLPNLLFLLLLSFLLEILETKA